MDRIRCGVIGLGWFGEHHVDTFKQLPQAELTAVCTRNPERLREVAAKYGVSQTYTDYRELLANPDIDLVSIVTHVGDHLEPTLAAIRAGKHVFLEKPMADTVEACDQILAALKSTDRAFMVGHICRFDTVYAAQPKKGSLLGNWAGSSVCMLGGIWRSGSPKVICRRSVPSSGTACMIST